MTGTSELEIDSAERCASKQWNIGPRIIAFLVPALTVFAHIAFLILFFGLVVMLGNYTRENLTVFNSFPKISMITYYIGFLVYAVNEGNKETKEKVVDNGDRRWNIAAVIAGTSVVWFHAGLVIVTPAAEWTVVGVIGWSDEIERHRGFANRDEALGFGISVWKRRTSWARDYDGKFTANADVICRGFRPGPFGFYFGSQWTEASVRHHLQNRKNG